MHLCPCPVKISRTSSNACSTVFTDTYTIDAWSYVCTTSPTVEALKNALYTYGPLVTTMDVYSDFYYYKSGVYQYTSGSYQGGHAILLVGYDDTLQAFLAKNSWGAGWGMSGYFWISYSQLNPNYATPKGCEFGYYTIAYKVSTPPPPPPPPSPDPCTYSVSPTGFNVPGASGTGYQITVTASAASGCSSWKPTTTAAWITIVSPTEETSGSGVVVFDVAPNPSRKTRTATISVADVVVKVTQRGKKK